MSLTKNATLPILIIGGGLAGSALAQILRSQSIPFQIFERDAGPCTRGQGWAVALTECLPRLTSLLPSDLGDIHCTSVNAPIAVPDIGAILHPTTGDVLVRLGGAPAGQPGHLIRASREGLRRYLWKDIDVQTKKQFSHYVEESDGVTAFFTDGSSVRGSILVGVDGAHSPVRAQLLSQTARPAPFIPIIGTVTLTRDEFEPVHAKGSAAVIAGGGDLRWLLSLINIESDRSSATYFYAVCYRTDRPQAEADWVRSATKTELFEKAVALTTSQPQFFRDILHKSGAENIHHPPLRFVEFEPPVALPSSRVTLAGDAAHTMMPFKGAGANTAFLDICEIADLLIEAKDHGFNLEDQQVVRQLLQRYESVVLPRGREMVAGSGASKGMEEILGIDKVMGPVKGGPAQEKIIVVREEDEMESRPEMGPQEGCVCQ